MLKDLMSVNDVKSIISVLHRMDVPNGKLKVLEAPVIGEILSLLKDFRGIFKANGLSVWDQRGQVRRDGARSAANVEDFHVRF